MYILLPADIREHDPVGGGGGDGDRQPAAPREREEEGDANVS